MEPTNKKEGGKIEKSMEEGRGRKPSKGAKRGPLAFSRRYSKQG